MKKLSFRAIATLAVPVLFLMGCETRSISDSGYRGRFAWESDNRYYRGELNEVDVLGASAKQEISEPANADQRSRGLGRCRVWPLVDYLS